MRLIIQPDYQSVSQWAAHYVAAKINPHFRIKSRCRILKNHLY